MHNLSERLSLIASMVPQGASVCDVGTDHGYLPAALCLSGKYKSVTATDIREKPLENAKTNIKKLGADGVKLVLCDGVDAVSEDCAEVIIIAGMGGDVISGIINRCPYKERSTFILQPMTAADKLREYLAESGFKVLSETAVAENRKLYSVMLCSFDGKKRILSPAKKRIGALKPDTQTNRKYIEKQLNVCEKCVHDLKRANINSAKLCESEEAVFELKKILEG